MNRFHEFVTQLLDRKHGDLGLPGEPDSIDAKIRINLDQISSVRQAHKDDKDDDTLGQCSLVYMNGGESYWLDYPYEDFCKLIDK